MVDNFFGRAFCRTLRSLPWVNFPRPGKDQHCTVIHSNGRNIELSTVRGTWDAIRHQRQPAEQHPRLCLSVRQYPVHGKQRRHAPSKNFCKNVRCGLSSTLSKIPITWSVCFQQLSVSWRSCWPLCRSTSMARGSVTCRLASNFWRMQ